MDTILRFRGLRAPLFTGIRYLVRVTRDLDRGWVGALVFGAWG